jgi:catechol 2,3-dioxygenase-like lactoylglutathione lyase family enzyme
MLGAHPIMAFGATNDPKAARRFYEDVLGLRFVEEHQWAIVFDAHGTMLRIQKVGDYKPQKFTMLGWEVPDAEAAVTELSARGVRFESFGFPGQDERGIWTTPDGARVAWFKDPDGNILSLTQLA